MYIDFDTESLQFEINLRHYDIPVTKKMHWFKGDSKRQFFRGLIRKSSFGKLRKSTKNIELLNITYSTNDNDNDKIVDRIDLSTTNLIFNNPSASSTLLSNDSSSSYELIGSETCSSVNTALDENMNNAIAIPSRNLQVSTIKNINRNHYDRFKTSLKPILKNQNANYRIELESMRKNDLIKFEDFLQQFEATELSKIDEDHLDVRLTQLNTYYSNN